MDASENVSHPSYYTKGGIEVYDVITAYGLGFDRGNACKYVLRAGEKNPATEAEDCLKGAWYLIAHSARLQGRRRSQILEEMLDKELQKEQ